MQATKTQSNEKVFSLTMWGEYNGNMQMLPPNKTAHTQREEKQQCGIDVQARRLAMY